jgi:L,D-peptidoglycan transpeptidase YkuD (ErfK/YbiS/YcfS/YnhG family)
LTAAQPLPIARRALLFLPLQLMVAGLSEAAPAGHENLEYRDGRLRWPSGSAIAAIGRSGVRTNKREGDGATPAGTYPLVSVYYRGDRIAPPASNLSAIPIKPDDGWVDDPADINYNRLVSLPYPASAEQMWREDGLYDVLAVIGYNVEPAIPGLGSAIFLHVAAPDFAPTAGCIAVEKEVLLGLLPLLGPGSTITIRS